MNIRYFFVTDQIEKRNLEVKYCPTNDMIGDFMTKPLQGYKFLNFRKLILGEDDNGDHDGQHKATKQEKEGIRKLAHKKRMSG